MIHPKKIVVIGGCATGLTAALDLSLSGHEVSLLEGTNRLGGHCNDREMGPTIIRLEQKLEKAGVFIHRRCRAILLQGLGNGVIISLKNGERFVSDFVVTTQIIPTLDDEVAEPLADETSIASDLPKNHVFWADCSEINDDYHQWEAKTELAHQVVQLVEAQMANESASELDHQTFETNEMAVA